MRFPQGCDDPEDEKLDEQQVRACRWSLVHGGDACFEVVSFVVPCMELADITVSSSSVSSICGVFIPFHSSRPQLLGSGLFLQ